jgi:hypothetical protein
MSDRVGGYRNDPKPGVDKQFVPKPGNGPRPGGAKLDSDKVGL